MDNSIIVTHLNNLQRQFAEIQNISLYYADGVLIASTFPDSSPIDEIGAVSSAFNAISRRAGKLFNVGNIGYTQLFTDNGVILIIDINNEAIAVIQADAKLNANALRPELRRAALAILNQLD
ncbi:MAG: roadblock/LC7 domain-containing protein [Cardiobacteriaceae bacterium]|nr:roadblock/LC7 domain-containing protein [Cardiobacteriaceae bacterium]